MCGDLVGTAIRGVVMVDTPKTDNPNPYQLFTKPVASSPSSGMVGDFIKNIFTVSPGSRPVAPVSVAPTPTLNLQDVQGPPIPQGINDRAAIFNAAQMQAGLVPQVLLPQNRIQNIPTPPARPALANFVSDAERKQIARQNLNPNVEARIPVPRGYTPPSEDARDEFRRQTFLQLGGPQLQRKQAVEDFKLQTERLKAQPKPPTIRDTLYGQGAKALNELYQLDVAAADALTDKTAKAKALQDARRNYLTGIRNLAQPPAAAAGLISGVE